VVCLGKNRGRFDLVAAVLDATGGNGTNKTRIMFAARLSFNLLEKYLGITLRLGFVESQGSSYSLTLQGREFLLRYRRFQELSNAVQRSLEKLGAERARLARLCMPPESVGSANPHVE
jgi:predicted transcriptional regulator